MIAESTLKLINYIEKEKYMGYDPYDTLNSWIPFQIFGKYGQAVATQIQKRNPFNIRPLIGIKKDYNSKGMGVLLNSFSKLFKITQDEEYLEKSKKIFKWLLANNSPGYVNKCWGYNFSWATPVKVVEKNHPTIVVSAVIGLGIFEYYNITHDIIALETLKSICTYILEDLPRIEDENEVCFSYSDIKKDICYNASALGAELLIKTYSLTNNKEYLKFATKAINFVIRNQHGDGHWNYSKDIITGKERVQIDFHQGYVLESIYSFIKYSGNLDEKYLKSLKTGTEYYYHKQFFKDGRSLWRIPKIYPVEIHNQAQGIICFSKFKDLNENYLSFSKTIIEYTIKDMQSKEGYFYYHKRRFYTHKIPYMRWSQSWMLLALVTYFENSGSLFVADK